MIYACGFRKYDFPETCCVFCKNADVFYDSTNGIYNIYCPFKSGDDEYDPIIGCNDNRTPFEEDHDFTVSEEEKHWDELLKFINDEVL